MTLALSLSISPLKRSHVNYRDRLATGTSSFPGCLSMKGPERHFPCCRGKSSHHCRARGQIFPHFFFLFLSLLPHILSHIHPHAPQDDTHSRTQRRYSLKRRTSSAQPPKQSITVNHSNTEARSHSPQRYFLVTRKHLPSLSEKHKKESFLSPFIQEAPSQQPTEQHLPSAPPGAL